MEVSKWKREKKAESILECVFLNPGTINKAPEVP